MAVRAVWVRAKRAYHPDDSQPSRTPNAALRRFQPVDVAKGTATGGRRTPAVSLPSASTFDTNDTDRCRLEHDGARHIVRREQGKGTVKSWVEPKGHRLRVLLMLDVDKKSVRRGGGSKVWQAWDRIPPVPACAD